MARRHTLKLRELRRIRIRFVMILAGMALVTLLIIAYLAIRVFVYPEGITYLDFGSLCFYGLASLVMTVAQIAFLRQLTVGAGRKIEAIAHTDELTGLGNRRHTARFLSEEFREAQLSKNILSLLFLDLDRFKQINDANGHEAGDLVLRAVGHALRDSVRETDFAGRVGGDEFVVVLPDTDSQCASVVAHRIAGRIADIGVTVEHDNANEPTVIADLTASIGISSYPANANTQSALIEDADRTMYAAKNAGQGHIVVSITRPAGPERRAPATEVNSLAAEIERIVDKGAR